MSIARITFAAARVASRVAAPRAAMLAPARAPTMTMRAFSAAAAAGDKQLAKTGGKGGKKLPTDLASVLERELAFEKEDSSAASTLADIAASVGDWTIEDAPGSARFTLTRKAGGAEVRLDVDCTPMPSEEEQFQEEEPEEDADEEAEGPADGACSMRAGTGIGIGIGSGASTWHRRLSRR
jgi:hypothetical protein